jgi:hypothetical protein
MQWQLLPETTMHAFDINALLTMIVINKLTDRTGADPKNYGNEHNRHRHVCVFTAALIVFTLGGKKLCSFP